VLSNTFFFFFFFFFFPFQLSFIFANKTVQVPFEVLKVVLSRAHAQEGETAPQGGEPGKVQGADEGCHLKKDPAVSSRERSAPHAEGIRIHEKTFGLIGRKCLPTFRSVRENKLYLKFANSHSIMVFSYFFGMSHNI